MMYWVISALLGIGLGVLSAYRTRWFLAAFAASVPIIAILMRPLLTVGASASAASGLSGPLAVYIQGFQMLPPSAQSAILFFPLFGLIGRMSGWFYRYASEQDPGIDPAMRDPNIFEEYGDGQGWAEVINRLNTDRADIARQQEAHARSKIKTFGQRRSG